MSNKSVDAPNGWLAFELNVLRRLKFKSVALPIASESVLGAYLKRWNARVSANDELQSAWMKSVAEIQNNNEVLTEQGIDTVLEDAYVPGYRLQNPGLRHWFGETDAWWFDNVRQNAERIESPVAHAIALKIGMSVGDYVLSFTEATRELRQPLSKVYRRLYAVEPKAVDNNQNNVCANKNIVDFTAESFADLMFLRLPKAHNQSLRNRLGWTAWREEWLRGADDFWADAEFARTGKLGTHVETKLQYLQLVEDALKAALHIDKWAIAHTEDGYITARDIVETVSRVRRVDTIYTKDFSELTGVKAVIITA